jgi:nucleotide-binding universal stress UspA family protein
MYSHLLVPLDGSELSERAALASLELARKLGARVTAFVAEAEPPLPHMGSNVAVYQHDTAEHLARTEAHARKVLDQFKARATELGVPCEGHFRRSNAVDDAIVAAAQKYGCDMIVMVTHGRGALGELLFGSHTKNVISRSQLPILVLH